ncbi:MAG: hypothetical protein ACOY0T_27660 [Myxococcota bacterium]
MTVDDVNGEVPPSWTDFYPFGEEDGTQRGGSNSLLVLSSLSGNVHGLDLEREQPIYFLNSSIDEFVDTFLAFDRYLSIGDAAKPHVQAMLLAIGANSNVPSEWLLLWDYLDAS